MWPTLIGAGLNLVGGLLGSSAEKKANDQNYQIAQQNLLWQQEQFRQLMEESHRQQAEGKLGYTDAQGNRVHFVEGKGWVTDLDPTQERLRNQYRTEEERQIAQDIPAKREQMFANIGRQRGEGGTADALMQAFKNQQLGSSRDVTGMRNLMSAEGINEGYDKTLEQALRNVNATGSSAGGQIMADVGRSRADALRKAFMENQAGAGAEAYNDYSTRAGNTAQLYNTMATRASGMPPVEYNPRNIEGATSQLMQGAAGAGAAGNTNLLNALGRQTPTLDFKATPQMGFANTISQLGNNVYAGLGGQQNYTNPFASYASGGNSNMFPAAPTYGGQGTSYYKGNVGAY
jgi:hypothetical protein